MSNNTNGPSGPTNIIIISASYLSWGSFIIKINIHGPSGPTK